MAYQEAQQAVQNSLEGEDSEEARVFRLGTKCLLLISATQSTEVSFSLGSNGV
jgi:hypothetical protein